MHSTHPLIANFFHSFHSPPFFLEIFAALPLFCTFSTPAKTREPKLILSVLRKEAGIIILPRSSTVAAKNRILETVLALMPGFTLSDEEIHLLA